MTQVEDERTISEIVGTVCLVYPFWSNLPLQGREVFRSVMVDLVAQAKEFNGLSYPDRLTRLHVPLADAKVVVIFNDALDMLNTGAGSIEELRNRRRIYMF